MRDLAKHLEDIASRLKDYPEGAHLPPHQPECFGCGPNNAHGLQMRVLRSGDGVATRQAFDRRHQGAPGIVHGGALAAAVDDLFGFVLYTVGTLAVTRMLTVDYLQPALLDVEYDLEAHLLTRSGRQLRLAASISQIDGPEVVTARATFIAVTLDHFDRSSSVSPPAARRKVSSRE